MSTSLTGESETFVNKDCYGDIIPNGSFNNKMEIQANSTGQLLKTYNSKWGSPDRNLSSTLKAGSLYTNSGFNLQKNSLFQEEPLSRDSIN